METRALVDSLDEVRGRLKSLGAVQGKIEKIVDEHYADLVEASPDKHTYEKRGKATRVRQLTSGRTTRIEVVIKEGLAKTTEGTFSHDLVRSRIIFSGEASKIDQARKLVREGGFPELVLVIKKTRETYSFKGMVVCLELIENFGPAVEIRTEVKNESQLARIKETQMGFLRELGVNREDILKTSHTHMLVSARVASDPKIKVPYLQKELRKLEKRLKEKMKASNLEYREAGDTWHDNLVWDSLMDEVGLLQARIRETKGELARTKTSG